MMKNNTTPSQQLGMIVTSMAVILIFACFLWVDLKVLVKVESDHWKWYAALIGGLLCLLSLLAGILNVFLHFRKYLSLLKDPTS